MAVLEELLQDLADETEAFLSLLEQVGATRFSLVTPAAPWTVTDTVAHLAFFDDQQRFAILDPSGFEQSVEKAMLLDRSLVDIARDTYVDEAPDEVVEWFETSRADLLKTFHECDPGERLSWFGPSMGVASAVTARLMETWAHGVDLADTIDVAPVASARLRHIALLAHRAMPFAYGAHGLQLPLDPLRFELTGPDEELWSFGDEDATSIVLGSALELCLVATHRRHVADTSLVATTEEAAHYLSIAQAFAGAPGQGRQPKGLQ